jgi:hypothetical protein
MALKKAFSQACENNRQPILNRLTKIFSNTHNVLEIGSGTGQHAVFFFLQIFHILFGIRQIFHAITILSTLGLKAVQPQMYAAH